MKKAPGLEDYVRRQRTSVAEQTTNGITPAPAAVARHAADDVRSHAKPRPAARRRRGRQAPTGAGDAWERVERARTSARTRPGDWVNYGVRLPKDLLRQIDVLVAARKKATGDRLLRPCHVISVALGDVPAALGEAAALGREWQEEHGVGVVRVTGSGRNVHRDVHAKMGSLTDRLPTLADTVATWEIAARAVELFVTQLEGKDVEPKGNDDGDGPREAAAQSGD